MLAYQWHLPLPDGMAADLGIARTAGGTAYMPPIYPNSSSVLCTYHHLVDAAEHPMAELRIASSTHPDDQVYRDPLRHSGIWPVG